MRPDSVDCELVCVLDMVWKPQNLLCYLQVHMLGDKADNVDLMSSFNFAHEMLLPESLP